MTAWQVFDDASVVVTANRDERLDRPACPLHLLNDSLRVIGPQDERAGGPGSATTNIGYSLGSSTAGRTPSSPANAHEGCWSWTHSRARRLRWPAESSRMRRSTRIRGIQSHRRRWGRYDPIRVKWSTPTDGVRSRCPHRRECRGGRPFRNSGIPQSDRGHPNCSTNGRKKAENTRRTRIDLRPSPDESHEEWLARTTATLRDHDYGFCVHHGEFGTRSSPLITLCSDGTVDGRFADGAPCETGVSIFRST